VGEGLSANPSASVFAFQFQNLDVEVNARDLALRLPNFSLYARNAAVVNGNAGPWRVPGELPTKDWGPIRSSYWKSAAGKESAMFTLGAIEQFARFFSASRSMQAYVQSIAHLVEPVEAEPVQVAAE